MRSDRAEFAKLLIDNGAKADIKDIDGETPLFVASTSRSSVLVKTLIVGGANPNAKAKDDWSCLMMAARDGDYDVTKALLDGGASISAARDMYGRTALDLVNMMQTGQGMRMGEGDSYEDAQERYVRVGKLLAARAN